MKKLNMKPIEITHPLWHTPERVHHLHSSLDLEGSSCQQVVILRLWTALKLFPSLFFRTFGTLHHCPVVEIVQRPYETRGALKSGHKNTDNTMTLYDKQFTSQQSHMYEILFPYIL